MCRGCWEVGYGSVAKHVPMFEHGKSTALSNLIEVNKIYVGYFRGHSRDGHWKLAVYINTVMQSIGIDLFHIQLI